MPPQNTEPMEKLGKIVHQLVVASVTAGAEAMPLLLVELESYAQTLEAKSAVQKANAAWLVFNQALASASRTIRDQPEQNPEEEP